MKNKCKFQIFIIYIILIVIGTCFTSVTLSNSLNYNFEHEGRIIDGQILFPPLYGTTTYLIDSTGAVNHTWSSSNTPGAATYWLGDGTILRTIRTVVGGGGSGGGIQKVLWDGTIVWDFRYNSNGHLSHHDINYLPNGNVLMIAWETKTRNEAIAAGRNPSYVSNQGLMPDHIIEVQPTGATSGEIVWEWYVWDHLIQDYDSSKDNYGVVGDHPELVDINYVTSNQADFMHTNSIDYNEEFDQILISVCFYSEIWVIDHSTTKEEAAGHTGGNSGKGGDLLYRWGNPKTYDAGTSSDQKLFGQHDTSWIKPGYPGEGNILVFNNGVNRPSGQYSSVDEFVPPVDSNGDYYLEPGSAYGPDNLIWSYTASPPNSFYSYYCGGAQRLKDGDTLICDGVAGKFFEVTPKKDIVWQYINKFPSQAWNDVFKIDYIPIEEPPPPEIPDLDCEGSISWTGVKPGTTVYGSFLVKNIGDPNSLLNWSITKSPNWGTWFFNPLSGTNLAKDSWTNVTITCITPNQPNQYFNGTIEVSNNDNLSDFCTISVDLTTPRIKTQDTSVIKFLQQYKSLLSILQILLNRLGQ